MFCDVWETEQTSYPPAPSPHLRQGWKAGAYNLWFNVARRNSGKEHRTPWELIHEREPRVDPAVCALPPVFLDELFMRKRDSKLM